MILDLAGEKQVFHFKILLVIEKPVKIMCVELLFEKSLAS